MSLSLLPTVAVYTPTTVPAHKQTLWTEAMLDAVRAAPSFVPRTDQAEIIVCDYETGFESWWPGTDDAVNRRPRHDELASAIADAPGAILETATKFSDKQVLVFEAAPACHFAEWRTRTKILNVRVASAAAHVYSFQRDWDISIPMFGLPHIPPEPVVRDCEWSFMGSMSQPIRAVLCDLKGGYVEVIESFSQLHIGETPSAEQLRYVELLARCWFTLCPRGDELYTFRFAEALRFNSIPVVVADGWQPPFQSIRRPEDYMLRVGEADILNVGDIIAQISNAQRRQMQAAGSEFYHNFMNSPAAVVKGILIEIASSNRASASSRDGVTGWRCSCGTWSKRDSSTRQC